MSIKERLLKELCCLASLECQEKYMLNPTKDKYLLCIDLIEDCESACKIALAESNKIYFSIEERKAIAKMLDKFTECDSKFWEEEEKASMTDYEDFIYHNSTFCGLRELALKTIQIFGYELDDLDYD
jgi:hypothetical protein